MPTFVYDMETLPNRVLFRAREVDTGERFDLWRHEPEAPARLKAFVTAEDVTLIGFNNRSFDDVIVSAFCAGRSELEIKRIADDIIVNRLQPWAARRKHMLPELRMDTIDLIEVAPSFVGLKAYGARMHMPLLQEMPLPHDEDLRPEDEPVVFDYCGNDLDTTLELLRRLDAELALRVQMSRQYGVDMRSKSDAQMAEAVYIKTMNLQRRENDIPATTTYTPPAFLKFQDAELQHLLERVSRHVFQINPSTGHVVLPDFLGKAVISFGSGTYQLGVGGIHSTHDKSICHIAGGDAICDIDAASFYPSIILECGFVPASLGQRFVDEYRKIYQRRLEAKRTGDKATNETLKISLNGTFGKLASRYSVLYAPDLMLAVTLTGQLTLLMLIEWLELAGAVTLSANTDGIAIRHPRALQGQIEHVVKRFSAVSRFEFEFTPYRLLAMKDVNNYFAVKPDRSLKEKGIYSPLGLKKNPTAGVCAAAVGQWLARGTPLLQTIQNAPFVDFISARNVTGGGEQGGVPLGKVVRWYQSTNPELGPLRYLSNGNKVPKSDGARACMTIDPQAPHPADLDYAWYHAEAAKIAVAVGCYQYLTPQEQNFIPVKKTKGKPLHAT